MRFDIKIRALSGAATLFITMLMLSGVCSASNWQVPLEVSNGSEEAKTINFGIHESGTSGIDPEIGEVCLPPWPPSSLFEVRLMADNCEGLTLDLRDTTCTERSHVIKWQSGEGGYPILISWDRMDLPPDATLFISDDYGEVFIQPVNMYEVDSLIIPSSQSYINRMKITVTPCSEPDASPEVTQIQDVTIFSGQQFPEYDLDDYVYDPDTPDEDIDWSIQGGFNLIFNIDDNRVLTVSAPEGWTGSEQITLTAEDQDGHSDYMEVAFSVIAGGSSSWQIPVTVMNAGSEIKTVYFGIHPEATDGIDQEFGEVALPPWPVSRIFDTRMLLPDGYTHSEIDLRESSLDTIVYDIEWQAGVAGYPVNISWPDILPEGSFSISDNKSGLYLSDLDMKDTTEVTFSAGESSVDGVVISVTADIDTVAPDIPGNFSCTDSVPGAVVLSWSPCSEEENFSYYEILYDIDYFAEVADYVWDYTEDGNLTNINTDSTRVVLPFIADKFYFRIRAWDEFGNCSPLSEIIEVHVPEGYPLDLELVEGSFSFSPQYPCEGIPVNLSAMATNLSDVDLGDIVFRFTGGDPYSGGETIYEEIVPFLASGDTVEVSCQWENMVQGSHDVFACINADKSIGEIDYGNNRSSEIIFVGNPQVVAQLQGPQNCEEGEEISYALYLNHTGTSPAVNINIQQSYDMYMRYLSSDPAPEAGTDSLWVIDTLHVGSTDSVLINVEASPSTPPGVEIFTSSTITYENLANVQMEEIEKTASTVVGIDTIPPYFILDLDPAYLKEGNVQVDISSSEELLGIPSVVITDYSGDTLTVDSLLQNSSTEYSVYFQIAASTPEGSGLIEIAGSDIALNEGVSTSNFVVDRTAPSGSFISSRSLFPQGEYEISFLANEILLTHPTISASDTLNTDISVEYDRNAGMRYYYILDVPSDVVDGPLFIGTNIVDRAINVNTVRDTFTLKTSAPTFSADIPAVSPQGEISVNVTSNSTLSNAPELNVIDEDNNPVQSFLTSYQGDEYIFKYVITDDTAPGYADCLISGADFLGNVGIDTFQTYVDNNLPDISLFPEAGPVLTGDTCTVISNKPAGNLPEVIKYSIYGDTDTIINLINEGDTLFKFEVEDTIRSFRVTFCDSSGNIVTGNRSYANLQVFSIDSLSAIPDGTSDIQVYSSLFNDGDIPIGNFEVGLMKDYQFIDFESVDRIEPGETLVTENLWPASLQEDEYAIFTYADPENLIAEYSENDNSAVFGSYYIRGELDRNTFTSTPDDSISFSAFVYKVPGENPLPEDSVVVEFNILDEDSLPVIGPLTPDYENTTRRFTYIYNDLSGLSQGKYLAEFSSTGIFDNLEAVQYKTFHILNEFNITYEIAADTVDYYENFQITGEVRDVYDQPVENASVDLLINSAIGWRRIESDSDDQGNFSFSFPGTENLVDQRELYIRASKQNITVESDTSTIFVHGLKVGPRILDVTLSENSSCDIDLTLANLSSSDIADIDIVLNDSQGEDGIYAQLNHSGYISSLSAGNSEQIPISINADYQSASAGTIMVDINSVNGASQQSMLKISTVPAKPVVSSDENYKELSLAPGEARTVTFKINNSGYDVLKDAMIETSFEPWMQLSSGSSIGDLQIGEEYQINIIVNPPADTEEGIYDTSMQIVSTNGQTYTLNLRVGISTDQTGTLTVSITDAENEPIEGADIRLYDQVYDLETHSYQVHSDKSGSDGLVTFSSIPARSYQVLIESEGYSDMVDQTDVMAGLSRVDSFRMDPSMVEVDFEVTPTTIEDIYQINMEATYSEGVPVLQGPFIYGEMLPGETRTYSYIMKNLGDIPIEGVDSKIAEISPYLNIQLLDAPQGITFFPGETYYVTVQITASVDAVEGEVLDAVIEHDGSYDVGGGLIPLAEFIPVTIRIVGEHHLRFDPTVILGGILAGEWHEDMCHEVGQFMGEVATNAINESPTLSVNNILAVGYGVAKNMDKNVFPLPSVGFGVLDDRPIYPGEVDPFRIFTPGIPNFTPHIGGMVLLAFAKWSDTEITVHPLFLFTAGFGCLAEYAYEFYELLPYGGGGGYGYVPWIGGGGYGGGGFTPIPPSYVIEDDKAIYKLYISQKAVLERDAFDAYVSIRNKQSSYDLSDVNVHILVYNESGTLLMDSAVNDGPLFFTDPDLTGISDIYGSGEIAAGDSAKVNWTIIPTPDAGGTDESGKRYDLGLRIDYMASGKDYHIPSEDVIVEDQEITVYPQPQLALKYFFPKYIGEQQPTYMGVKVTNDGYGEAHNFSLVDLSIQSGGPLQLQITGSSPSGAGGSSFDVDLGDIQPGESKVAYWALFNQGTYVTIHDIDANFSHSEELGGDATALIGSVDACLLKGMGVLSFSGLLQSPANITSNNNDMAMVTTDDYEYSTAFFLDSDEDGYADILLDGENGDEYSLTYRETVNYVQATFNNPITTFQIEGDPEGGWFYTEFSNPFGENKEIGSITRSDGKTLEEDQYSIKGDSVQVVDNLLGTKEYTVAFETPKAPADLIPDSLAYQPDSPMGGNPLIIKLFVTNQGEKTASGIPILLYDAHPDSGGVVISDTLFISELAEAETDSVVSAWNTFGYSGEHEIFARVDPGGKLIETDRTNNTISSAVNIERPEIVSDYWYPAEEISLDPENPIEGDSVYISTHIHRTCFYPPCESDTFAVAVYDGHPDSSGVLISSDSAMVMNKGDSIASYDFWWYSEELYGSYEFYYYVDAFDSIPELHEDNNLVSRELTISPSTDFVAYSDSLFYSPTAPVEGDTVTVEAIISKVEMVSAAMTVPGKDSLYRKIIKSPLKRDSIKAKNNGVDTLVISFFADADGYPEIPIGSDTILMAEGTDTSTIEWMTDNYPGSYSIRTELDYINIIDEYNEDNNTATVPIYIKGAADFLFTSPAEFSPDFPREGEDVYFSFYVGVFDSTQSFSGLKEDNKEIMVESAKSRDIELLNRKQPAHVIADRDLSNLNNITDDSINLNSESRNLAGRSLPDSVIIRLYDDLPENGGVSVAPDMILRDPEFGQSYLLTTAWNSQGSGGYNSFYAVIDPGEDLDEYSIDNNIIGDSVRVYGNFLSVGEAIGLGDSTETREIIWHDYNYDNLPDLFVVINGENIEYGGIGSQSFDEITETIGLSDNGDGNNATWGDIDNDRSLDLYLSNAGNSRLYMQDASNQFQDISMSSAIGNVSGVIESHWLDYDCDGFLDLLCLNVSGNVHLYHNNWDNQFADSTLANGLNITGQVNHVELINIDNDRDIDLYFVIEGSNIFYRNNGNGYFTEAALVLGLDDAGDGIYSCSSDFNNDGFMDIYLLNEGNNRLYINQNDTLFADSAAYYMVDDTTSGQFVNAFDFNNDSWIDIFLVDSTSHNRLYENRGNGYFENVASIIGLDSIAAISSISTADYSRDGFSDISFGRYNKPNLFYENASSTNNYLDIILEGQGVSGFANRTAYGATVNLFIEGVQKEYIYGYGMDAGGDGYVPLHIGLGNSTYVDSLVISWPSGSVERCYGLSVNRKWTFKEQDYIEEVRVTDPVTPPEEALIFDFNRIQVSLDIHESPGGTITARETLAVGESIDSLKYSRQWYISTGIPQEQLSANLIVDYYESELLAGVDELSLQIVKRIQFMKDDTLRTRWIEIPTSVDTTNNRLQTTEFIPLNSYYTITGQDVQTDTDETPSVYHLSQNYPNPFNATTTIKYMVPRNGRISLKIFDPAGRLIKTCIDGYRKAGVYRYSWDGCNNANNPVVSGVYFYRFEASNFTRSRKMILIR